SYGRKTQSFEVGEKVPVGPRANRRTASATAIIFHGGSFPEDCSCGRRSGGPQGLEPVVALALSSGADFRIRRGISCGVENGCSRMSDCRSTDAGHEWIGASRAPRE